MCDAEHHEWEAFCDNALSQYGLKKMKKILRNMTLINLTCDICLPRAVLINICVKCHYKEYAL